MKKITSVSFLLCMIGILVSLIPIQAQSNKNYTTCSVKPQKDSSSNAGKATLFGLPALSHITSQKTQHKTSADKPGFTPILSAEVPTLHGCLVNRDTWDENNYAYGIYSFPALSGTRISDFYLDNRFATGNGVYANGKYYFYTCAEYIGFIYETAFYTYNTDPWERESSAECKLSYSSIPTSAISYDPVTDKIYAISYNDDASGFYFSEIANLETGLFKHISTIEKMYTLAAYPDGKLYGINSEGILKSIDKFSGMITTVGATGLKPQGDQSMVTDWETGKLYWTAYGENISGLYEVNIKNGAATLISNFPQKEEFVGLHFPDKKSLPGAPSNIEKLTATQEGKNVSVKITVPSKQQNGQNLTDKVSIIVTIDGIKIDESLQQPGNSYQKSLSLTDGVHVIAVQAMNNIGANKVHYKQIYIGKDSPQEVSNVLLEVNGSKAKLTWDPPTKSVHGGAFDANEITYKVIRWPGNTVITEHSKTNSLEEQLPTVLDKYYYQIIACSTGGCSQPATSNYVVTGEALPLPYLQNFNTKDNLSLITLIDANEDGISWFWRNQEMVYTTNADEDANDWLITPPLQMEIDYDYKVSFKVHASDDDYPESMKLTLGKTTDIVSQQTVLIDLSSITNSFHENQSTIFTVPEKGSYTIGLNIYSEANSYNLYLDSLTIRPYAAIKGPKAVEKFQVNATDKGILNTTITFTAPSFTRTNEKLTALPKIEIYKGEREELLYTFTSCTPGKEYFYSDNNVPKGWNTYTVVAYNEYGAGEEAYASVFSGPDIPGKVTDLKISSVNNNKAVVSWQAPKKGVNGGYIDPSTLKYTVYRYNDNAYKFEPVKNASNITKISIVDSIIFPENTTQVYANYMVQTSSDKGVGLSAQCGEMIGIPCDLPYKESFTNIKYQNGKWVILTLKGGFPWMIGKRGMDAGATPYDQDDGLLNYYNLGTTEAEAIAISPKIDLSTSDRPVLKFVIYHTSTLSTLNWVLPQIYRNNQYVTVGDTIYANKGSGWMQHTVNLTDYKEQPVSIVFRGHIDTMSSGVALDKITIENSFDDDLGTIMLQAPAKIDIGGSGILKAFVYNYGTQTASGYKVEFYRGEELLEQQSGLEINPKDTIEYSLTVSVDAAQGNKSHIFSARIMYSKDMNKKNDKAITSIDFVDRKYPRVNDLKGEVLKDKGLLTWSRPEIIAIENTDNIDYYDPFIIDNIGNWTVLDADGQSVYTINNYNYPYKQKPNAYQVWNPSFIGMEADIWQPYSGKQCLVSWAAAGEMPDGEEVKPQNDDWLISPEVAGNTRLSFYANESTNKYGDETIEILISETDRQKESFKVLQQSRITLGWNEYSYSLPEKTKYFAIRHISEDVFALLIDDITYTSTDNLSLNLLGYHVYRNEKRITNNMLTDTRFEDNYDKDAEYTISVVYDRGESGLSNKIKIGGSKILSQDGTVHVYTINNTVVIKNAVNKPVSIYHTDGSIVYKQLIKEPTETIILSQGVYIIQIQGEKNVKIVVN